MLHPPILTTEFTQQLEQHIAPNDAAAPLGNSEVRRFGKTIARKVSGGWPASEVFCFNADDVGRLGEILAFFGDIRPVFYLVHGGYRPEIGIALHAAGFFPAEWKQTILFGVPVSEPVAPPTGITIESVTSDNIEAAAEVAAEGNGWDSSWRESAKDGIRRTLHSPGATMFLARYHAEPAGVGNLSCSRVSPRWCGFGGGAVVPKFRRKGIHTALLRYRLQAAFEAGYELVISGADFGTTSFRNQQRVGLRLGYIETTWKKAGSP